MISIILIFIFLFKSFPDYNSSEKELIRRLFYFSIESKDTLKIFEDKLKKIDKELDSNFKDAYYGAYLTLVAKHSINPYTKYFKLKEGLEFLNKSIKNDPEKLEFRFLRLSILNYVPSFLGFDNFFYEDYRQIKNLIIKKDYTELDRKIHKGILEFLLRSQKISEDEKHFLGNIYKDFK
ncbi:MAG: hypothetical protein NC934_07430 [Candidatus Omnitrophica bacterium]|nr:hypothetical protein [Candidatus Omnitrophota bacterium]